MSCACQSFVSCWRNCLRDVREKMEETDPGGNQMPEFLPRKSKTPPSRGQRAGRAGQLAQLSFLFFPRSFWSHGGPLINEVVGVHCAETGGRVPSYIGAVGRFVGAV